MKKIEIYKTKPGEVPAQMVKVKEDEWLRRFTKKVGGVTWDYLVVANKEVIREDVRDALAEFMRTEAQYMAAQSDDDHYNNCPCCQAFHKMELTADRYEGTLRVIYQAFEDNRINDVSIINHKTNKIETFKDIIEQTLAGNNE